MILAVIGSRSFKNKNRVYLELNEFRKLNDVTAIVSGVSEDDKADTGPDTYGRDYALDNGLKYYGCPAKWDDMSEPCRRKTNKYGKDYNALAGFNRNADIIAKGEKVMAFHDGKSPGTQDSINKAKALGKEVILIKI